MPEVVERPEQPDDGAAASVAARSVHDAGSNERAPSGSSNIRTKGACRRIQPKACNDLPRERVMVYGRS